MDCASSRKIVGLQVTQLAHGQVLVGGRLWPAVNPATSQSRALVVARDDKVCKVFERSHGEVQSLEVVLNHTRIVRYVAPSTEEGRCSQGDYSLFRE